jgi:GNAT superfamily N-acetyltransferase
MMTKKEPEDDKPQPQLKGHPENLLFELYDNTSDDKTGPLTRGVELALKHRLYVPSLNYCLREELIELKDYAASTTEHRIALAKDMTTGKYVCCIYLKHWHLQSFTRKAYRKKGIAKATIKRLGKLPDEVYALGGIEGALTFWERVGINAF